ncbi:uncharacterized protein [Antedon mediterranea]|uniref:uncharacterized protein n=1 Tax=Antedon mediterranea TaxID=105859 RepID=UPI003AF822CE
MLSIFQMLLCCVSIPGTMSCWSTSDCPVCPVTDSDGEQKPTTTQPSLTLISGVEASPPILSNEQSDILRQLGDQLDSLSCEELENTIYNTTRLPLPPIELDVSQAMILIDIFPELKKTNADRPTENEINACNEFETDFLKSVNAANVCAFDTADIALNLALDKHGFPVYVTQDTRYNLLQMFQENLCLSTDCGGGLQCSCNNQLTHNARAVVSYLKGNDFRFYKADIQLRSCSGFV